MGLISWEASCMEKKNGMEKKTIADGRVNNCREDVDG